jgi:hypothetical protein
MKKSVKHFAKKSKEKYYSLSHHRRTPMRCKTPKNFQIKFLQMAKFEKMMFGLFAIFILFFLVAILISGILNAYPYVPAGGATITTTNIWEIVDGITRLIVPSDVNISGGLNISKNLNVVGNITGKNLEIKNLNVNNTFFVNSTSGNVGIGTTNPTSKLEVNGTTKLGSDGTGIMSVKMFTGTFPSSVYSTAIGFPSGWSATDNIVILSYGYQLATNDWWYFFPQNGGPTYGLYARVAPEGIVIGFSADQWGKPYRVVVAKFE